MTRGFRSALLVLALFLAAAPLSAKTLTIAVPGLPESLGNPFTGVGHPSTVTWSAMFDGLTMMDSRDGQVHPWLAESWTQTDAKTWRVVLRPGLRFSNGTPLDAEAVLSTLAFLKSADAQSFRVAGEFTKVESARAIDARTLEFALKAADPLFPRTLALLTVLEPAQLKSRGISGFAQAPIGSGPYKLERWETNRAVFTANPYAWVKPPSESLEIVALPDATSRVQGMVSGLVDISSAMEPGDAESLARIGGKLNTIPLASTMQIVFIQTREGASPLKNKRVRQALNYAVDKRALTEILLAGVTQPSGQFAARGTAGFDETIAPYPHDPAKAEALLKEAGYEKGFTFSVEIIVGAGMQDAAIQQQVAADLAAVGVTMRLQPIPVAQYSRNSRNGEWKGDAFLLLYNSDVALDSLWGMRFHSCLNPVGWYCDRALQPLIDQAFAAATLEERSALTRQVMRAYSDEAYALFLYEAVRLMGTGPRVKTFGATSSRIRFDEISVE
jgi:peptide/nickel transport system substrate-binding protein